MLPGILAVIAAGTCAILVSRFMWWGTKRSAVWAMAAGSLLAVLALGGGVAFAWFYTRYKFP
jgi:hypothetical protein